jgi:DNA-binding XRE family transcriptional regulator
MDILANNIATIRARWGMEQVDFAEVVGVTRYVVGNWERGRNRPDLETMVRLESLAGFPLAVLIGRELDKSEIPGQPLAVGEARVSSPIEKRLEVIEGMLRRLVGE